MSRRELAPIAGAVLLAAPPAGEDALLWSSVAGRPLLAWSLAALRAAPQIGLIALVVPRPRLDDAARLIAEERFTAVHALALPPGAPAATAHDFARLALTPRPQRARRASPLQHTGGDEESDAAAASEAMARRWGVRRTSSAGAPVSPVSPVSPVRPEVFVLHDAARPLVHADHIAALVAAAAHGEAGVAVSAEPVKETIKRVAEGRVVETLPRDELAQLIPPLAVRADRLPALLAAPGRPSLASIMNHVTAALALGETVRTVPLAGPSLAVTTPEELALAEVLLKDRR